MKTLGIMVITIELASQMSSEKPGVPLNGILGPE